MQVYLIDDETNIIIPRREYSSLDVMRFVSPVRYKKWKLIIEMFDEVQRELLDIMENPIHGEDVYSGGRIKEIRSEDVYSGGRIEENQIWCSCLECELSRGNREV